jgi:hypothetical protein
MAVSIERARAILGHTNVHDPRAVTLQFGYHYCTAQLTALQEVPFGEDTLRACAGTHLLVAGAPLSILQIQQSRSWLLFRGQNPWYETEEFAAQPVALRWHLLRKEPHPGSLGKPFADQTALLSQNEEVPPAGVVVYAVLLHYQATLDRLLQYCWVRSREEYSRGYHVGVGDFAVGGLDVYGYWDGGWDSSLGLASARKFPVP